MKSKYFWLKTKSRPHKIEQEVKIYRKGNHMICEQPLSGTGINIIHVPPHIFKAVDEGKTMSLSEGFDVLPCIDIICKVEDVSVLKALIKAVNRRIEELEHTKKG